MIAIFRWQGRFHNLGRDFQPRRDYAWRIYLIFSFRSAVETLRDQSQDLIGGQRNDAKH